MSFCLISTFVFCQAYGCNDEPILATAVFIDGKLYPEQSKEHPDLFKAYKLLDDLIVESERYLTSNENGKHCQESSEKHR